MRLSHTLAAAGFALLVFAWLFRFDMQVIGAGPAAYRLDRWDGSVSFITLQSLKPVVPVGEVVPATVSKAEAPMPPPCQKRAPVPGGTGRDLFAEAGIDPCK